jgi:hypothetical protein
MLDQNADLSWLGAESRPGDLAEINRVYEAWHDAAARDRRQGDKARPLGLVAIVMRWFKG